MKRIPVKRMIRQMTRTIVDQFNPDRIILFGSYARGTAGPESDVDLLVVMPLKGTKRDQRIEILLSLLDIKVPKDVFVSTPEDFAWRKDITGTIEYPADHEGQVLYVRK